MKAQKTLFVCTECGATSPKWLGKCPDCGAWNSLEEEAIQQTSPTTAQDSIVISQPAMRMQDLEASDYIRYHTGIGEVDRVLGGGLVEGSVVLLSGEPGVGKSTLLLQICNTLSKNKRVLYVSGEESRGQIKLRYSRLGLNLENLWLLVETSAEAITQECERIKPDVLLIDSVQTIFTERSSTSPGSVTQVREATAHFIRYAKSTGTAVFLVGHVNKEGGISGPKMLEHMVDAVLYFEGDKTQTFRLIRANKNRFGSTNEIGVFLMTDRGLEEVENPSEMLMEQRAKGVSGSCAACVMEGTRPLVAEVQALVTSSIYAAPKRAAVGFDHNRMCLILAVLEKRLGVRYSQHDVYLNIAGGVRPNEPAADLPVALALISGLTDRLVPDDMVVFGELGLAGEVRAVSNVEYRIKESIRLGFKTIVLPKRSIPKRMSLPEDIKLIGVTGIYETLTLLRAKES